MVEEIWKGIPNFEPYECSSFGRVRRFDKILKTTLHFRTRNKSPYERINLRGKNFRIHRLVWEVFVGPIADGIVIDHKNTNALDNRLDNLREATTHQNNWNLSARGSLPKGVRAQGRRFKARIMYYGKRVNLGLYDSVEEAANAYAEAAKVYFGEFANFS